MSSHTPGPWFHVATEGGWDGVALKNGALICALCENNPANANLIAAAPDLLAALKTLCAAVDRIRGPHGPPGDGTAVAAARAAMAKAEGAG
jgi:hypothetical protein